ncbi:MAG: aminoacyl-histidine dipeptidase [Lachnospiraceae bacterium]|jgi:dipeptidase D|nr:aminoacyl-histidine dipeptidase [Lachnospiraceae bacterium]
MKVCEHLQPQKVFSYFEEICQIPHGSRNTKEISDYCVAFAKSQGLKYIQDESNNVIIFKDGSKGYENAEPVIIQGHLDMVCEKESDVEIDFQKDGLKLSVDGDFLFAEGTTLGGDDGIAVAYALALLADDSLEHPPLEVVLTVDEEIGLLGAEAIDLSMLKGRRLLNIDSEEEGIFLTSCAGGLGAACNIPVTRVEEEGVCYEIQVTGLLGGHSGIEIQKERGNGIFLLGRVLCSLGTQIPFSIEHLEGGLKDNAIPRQTTAKILLESDGREEELMAQIQVLDQELKKEYQTSDPDIAIRCQKLDTGKRSVLQSSSATKLLFFLRTMPNGVQNMSRDIEGLVETSLNAGIMQLSEDVFCVRFSVRSSVTSRKYELADRLVFLTEFLGGEIEINGDYPAWEYNPNSKIRDMIAETYRELFHKEPKVEAVHAGLECGILSDKIPDLDCISFGPDMYDVHTPQERLSISSTARVWELLVEFLKRLK